MKIRNCLLAAKIVIIFTINSTSHQPQIKTILGINKDSVNGVSFLSSFCRRKITKSKALIVFFSSVTRLDDADSLSMRSVFHSSWINYWRAHAISNWWIALHGSLVLALLPHPLISFSINIIRSIQINLFSIATEMQLKWIPRVQYNRSGFNFLDIYKIDEIRDS